MSQGTLKDTHRKVVMTMVIATLTITPHLDIEGVDSNHGQDNATDDGTEEMLFVLLTMMVTTMMTMMLIIIKIIEAMIKMILLMLIPEWMTASTTHIQDP